MANISKNQRRGTRGQKFIHATCGGEIKMRGVYKGKLSWEARCEQCGETHRRPSDFALT